MKNLVKGVIRKAAHAAIEKTTPMDTNIAEITPYTFRKIDFPEKELIFLFRPLIRSMYLAEYLQR